MLSNSWHSLLITLKIGPLNLCISRILSVLRMFITVFFWFHLAAVCSLFLWHKQLIICSQLLLICFNGEEVAKSFSHSAELLPIMNKDKPYFSEYFGLLASLLCSYLIIPIFHYCVVIGFVVSIVQDTIFSILEFCCADHQWHPAADPAEMLRDYLAIHWVLFIVVCLYLFPESCDSEYPDKDERISFHYTMNICTVTPTDLI